MLLRTRHWSLWVGVGFTLAWAAVYAMLAPSLEHQNWDSLSYAADIDQRNWQAIGPNHPLGHVLSGVALAVARAFAYDGTALPVLGLLNSVLAGCAGGGVFWLALRLSCSWGAALGLACVFSGSAAMWRYAGTADIYALAVILTVAVWHATLTATRRGDSRWWCITGMLVGVAMAAHQFCLVAGIGAGIMAITSGKANRWRAVCVLGVCTFLTGVVLYGLLWRLATWHTGAPSLLPWAAGYGGDGSTMGRSLSLGMVPTALATLSDAFLGRPWGRVALLARWTGIFFCSLFVVVTLVLAVRGEREPRRMAVAAFVSAVCASVLVWWAAPWAVKYWLVVLLPLIVVAAAGCAEIGGSPRLAGLGVVVMRIVVMFAGVGVVLFNTQFVARSQCRDSPAFAGACETWLRHTRREDMLVTAGDLTGQLKFVLGRPNAFPAGGDLLMQPDPDRRCGQFASVVGQADAEGREVYVAPAFPRYMAGFLLPVIGWRSNEAEAVFADLELEPAFTYTNTIDGAATPVMRVVSVKSRQ